MNNIFPTTKLVLALAMTAILAASPALAEKPSWAGNDKGGKNERGDQRDEQRDERKNEHQNEHQNERKDDRRDDERNSHNGKDHRSDGDRPYFQPQQQVVVREYYAEHYRGHSCPPGLAKKNNGCMPPGQAKKWRVGYQLPREVIFYSVPAPLVVRIGPPPAGQRYVRVAGDILLIAVGTGLVIDAIADLGNL